MCTTTAELSSGHTYLVSKRPLLTPSYLRARGSLAARGGMVAASPTRHGTMPRTRRHSRPLTAGWQDFKGQKYNERLFQTLVILFGIIGCARR